MTATGSPADRPIVLLHGFGSNTDALWRKFGWVEALEDKGRVVIGIDLPGHGTSKDISHSDPVDLLFDEADKRGPVDAVGFSAGAWALLAAAGERPALFHRIAVIGAGDMVLTQGMHTPAMQRPMVEALRSTTEPVDNPMATAILALIADAGNDRNAVADYLTTEKHFPTVEDLARITATTLVVESNADAAGPSDLIARTIPHTERFIVDGADHFELPTRAECKTTVMSFLNAESR